LATLGSATRNRNNPIYVMPPKVAKASTVCVAGAGIITHTLPVETWLYISKDCSIVTGKNTSDS
jgi:hypothetical protein